MALSSDLIWNFSANDALEKSWPSNIDVCIPQVGAEEGSGYVSWTWDIHKWFYLQSAWLC